MSRLSGRGASRLAQASWPLRFFTNHESRNTNHGLFITCSGHHVVKNAGQQGVGAGSPIRAGLAA